MRQIILSFFLAYVFFANAAAADRPEVSRYLKAYSGGEGIVVWVLRYGPPENQEALVQIAGIDHGWDGRIQRVKIEPMQNGNKYVAEVKGKRIDVLFVDNKSAELYVTGQRWTSALSYDKVLSEKAMAQAFLTDYLEQK